MERTVTIVKNSFLSILSDALILYELSKEQSDKNIKATLAKSSILSVNFALEAAANSFLSSLTLSDKMKKEIDKLSTLDKFDFNLQWHTDNSLNRGDSVVQVISELIKSRNESVHPKIKETKIKITSKIGTDKIGYYHKETENSEIKKKAMSKITADPSQFTEVDALLSIKHLVSFLNKYVTEYWRVDLAAVELLLITSWDGSINALPIMYEQHHLEIILRNNDELQIKFLGLYGILEQFA